MLYPTPTRKTTLAATTALLLSAPAAFADKANAQVAMAGELRALVHEAMASACMINAGVAVDAEMVALADARNTFNATVDALGTTGMTEEVTQVEANWVPLDEAISMILAGDTPAGYVETMKGAQPSLEFATLSLMDHASQIHQRAENVSTSDMVTIDLAERQEVIVQQMKLMACEMTDPAVTTDAQDTLKDTMNVYERTLTALTDGVPEMGIAAPTNYATSQVLAASAFDWQSMKPVLETIADTGTATPEQLGGLRLRASGLDARMASLVDIYLAPVGADGQPQVAVLEDDAE